MSIYYRWGRIYAILEIGLPDGVMVRGQFGNWSQLPGRYFGTVYSMVKNKLSVTSQAGLEELIQDISPMIWKLQP